MSKDKERDVLITPEEAAQQLAVAANTVRSWLREGVLPGIKIGKGRVWRIRQRELDNFINREQGEQK